MKVGALFNPYRVFQGIFAPYWLLEHQGIGAGAKLCYVRLLGFAGKDGRCYPSLERLGTSLGVSERQARDYVRELERSGLILVEQRGLRRTNVYQFVWTTELESLKSSVAQCSEDDPDDPKSEGGDASPDVLPDRNNPSGQDRNTASPPDRNNSSGQDRNRRSVPSGISSGGICSQESSSSSFSGSRVVPEPETRRMTESGPEAVWAEAEFAAPEDGSTRTAQIILNWAGERGLQRLRTDRQIGLPQNEHLTQWSAIFANRGIIGVKEIFGVLDEARASADRSGPWRNWAFLTLSVQLAAERLPWSDLDAHLAEPASQLVDEDPTCEWARVKAKIKTQIPTIPFTNWFVPTRQVERKGNLLIVGVPDESARSYLESEYSELVTRRAAVLGIGEIRFVAQGCESGPST